MDKEKKYENTLIQIYSNAPYIVYYDYELDAFFEENWRAEKMDNPMISIFIPIALGIGYATNTLLTRLPVSPVFVIMLAVLIIHCFSVQIYKWNWRKNWKQDLNLKQIKYKKGIEYARQGKRQFLLQKVIVVALGVGCFLLAFVYYLTHNFLMLILCSALYLIEFFLIKGFKIARKRRIYKKIQNKEEREDKVWD
ncbi:MAG: hypothetical protein RR678_11455 [Lachnospiraceae bacterium]